MNRISPDAVKTIGVIGGGTIGASWAAYFLSRGFQVIAVDPVVTATSLHEAIEQMWPALEVLGLDSTADKSRWTLYPQIDDNLADVDFVQENSIENISLKQTIMAELEQVVRPEVVISSSTTSLLASDIQATCQTPERVVVGHPFNPPHLMPLVEVVGGRQTAPDVVEWAMTFYRLIGKHPVRVKKERVGHIANRLQAAVYREAVYMIAEGIGTVADVDAAMRYGPGLRWALMGPHLTYHLGGGRGGIQHYLEHLGPTQESRWQDLGHPQLTDEVKQKIIEGVLEAVEGESIEELTAHRDEGLVQLLKLAAEWDR